MKSHYGQIIRQLTRDKEEATTLYSELKEQLKMMSLESKKWQQQAALCEKTMRDSTAEMKHGSRYMCILVNNECIVMVTCTGVKQRMN